MGAYFIVLDSASEVSRPANYSSTTRLQTSPQFRPQLRCKPPGALGHVIGIKCFATEWAGSAPCCQARGPTAAFPKNGFYGSTSPRFSMDSLTVEGHGKPKVSVAPARYPLSLTPRLFLGNRTVLKTWVLIGPLLTGAS